MISIYNFMIDNEIDEFVQTTRLLVEATTTNKINSPVCFIRHSRDFFSANSKCGNLFTNQSVQRKNYKILPLYISYNTVS